jgi:phage baseplate assembly protein W
MAIKYKWKFESGGINNNDLNDRAKENASQNEKFPIGISLPIIFSNNPNDFLEMNYKIKDELNDSIRNILYTNPGERLCFPDLGVDLKSIITNNNDLTATIDVVSSRITTVLKKYMPGIMINEITTNYSDEERRKYNVPVIIVTINYSFLESVNNIDIMDLTLNEPIFGRNVLKRNQILKIKIGTHN